jgi:hypothetical protein
MAHHNSRLLNCNAENRCSLGNGMDTGKKADNDRAERSKMTEKEKRL